MASGVYGKADLSASTWTTLVPAPTAGTKVCTVNLVNRTAANGIRAFTECRYPPQECHFCL